MSDQTTSGGRTTRWARAAGLLAAGALGGAVLAGTLSAAAQSGTETPSGDSPSSSDTSGGGRDGPGAEPVRSDESSVSSDVAATLESAALDAVPGGTVYRIETDAGDGEYEAHMTDANGASVTVKFDENLEVIAVQDGMGSGDPAPSGDTSDANSG